MPQYTSLEEAATVFNRRILPVIEAGEAVSLGREIIQAQAMRIKQLEQFITANNLAVPNMGPAPANVTALKPAEG